MVGSLPKPGPTCQATDGMLRSMTSEYFSADLMKCQPEVVHTYILDYVEVPGRPDQLQVQGIAKDVSPIVVRSICDEKVEPSNKKLRRNLVVVPLCDEVDDFLEDMMASKQQQQQNKNGGRDNGQGTFVIEQELEQILATENAAYDEIEHSLQALLAYSPDWAADECTAECEEDSEHVDAALQEESEMLVEEAESAHDPPPFDEEADPPPPDETSTLSRFLVTAGWSEHSVHQRWHFHKDLAQSSKRCLTVFPLSGMKGVCLFHNHCVCWLSEKSLTGKATPLLDLVQWCHGGMDGTREQHVKSSQLLKAKYGMKVKVPA